MRTGHEAGQHAQQEVQRALVDQQARGAGVLRQRPPQQQHLRHPETGPGGLVSAQVAGGPGHQPLQLLRLHVAGRLPRLHVQQLCCESQGGGGRLGGGLGCLWLQDAALQLWEQRPGCCLQSSIMHDADTCSQVRRPKLPNQTGLKIMATGSRCS